MCDPVTGEPMPPESAEGPRKAVDALGDASRAQPNDAELHRVFGEYLLITGSNNAAVNELRTAADHEEDSAPLAMPLAFALLRTDRLEDLRARPVPANATPHQRAILYSVNARAAEAMRDYPAATVSLQKALDADPRNLSVIVALGMLYLRRDETAIAKRWLDQAAEINPDAAATLGLRGEYAYATKDFAASADAYGKLVALGASGRHGPVPPSLGLARAQIYAGDPKAATATLDHAPLPANDPGRAYYLALIAFRAGDFQRAAELAEPLAGRMPGFPSINLLLGAAQLANGNLETARRSLERYAGDVPADQPAQTLLADTIDRLDNSGNSKPVSPEQLYAALGFTPASQR